MPPLGKGLSIFGDGFRRSVQREVYQLTGGERRDDVNDDSLAVNDVSDGRILGPLAKFMVQRQLLIGKEEEGRVVLCSDRKSVV